MVFHGDVDSLNLKKHIYCNLETASHRLKPAPSLESSSSWVVALRAATLEPDTWMKFIIVFGGFVLLKPHSLRIKLYPSTIFEHDAVE
jgi:hypothetical protein